MGDISDITYDITDKSLLVDDEFEDSSYANSHWGTITQV